MGLRLHKPGRRVVLLVIILVIAAGGVGVYIMTRKDKAREPQTAAEAVKDEPTLSSPSEARLSSLKNFAEKTKNMSEKYKSYVQLCNDYDTLSDFKSAKDYCEKALAIADQAGVKAEDKKTLQNLKDYIDAKIETASKTPEPVPGGYVEPKE